MYKFSRIILISFFFLASYQLQAKQLDSWLLRILLGESFSQQAQALRDIPNPSESQMEEIAKLRKISSSLLTESYINVGDQDPSLWKQMELTLTQRIPSKTAYIHEFVERLKVTTEICGESLTDAVNFVMASQVSYRCAILRQILSEVDSTQVARLALSPDEQVLLTSLNLLRDKQFKSCLARLYPLAKKHKPVAIIYENIQALYQMSEKGRGQVGLEKM